MLCGLYNFSENNYLHGHDLQSSTDEYTNDAHGNMTSMPHLPEMKYDYADQLNEVKLDASNNKAYCGYDAEGNRVRKIMINNNNS